MTDTDLPPSTGTSLGWFRLKSRAYNLIVLGLINQYGEKGVAFRVVSGAADEPAWMEAYVPDSF